MTGLMALWQKTYLFVVRGIPPGNVLYVIPGNCDDVGQLLAPPVGVQEWGVELGLARVRMQPRVGVIVENLNK